MEKEVKTQSKQKRVAYLWDMVKSVLEDEVKDFEMYDYVHPGANKQLPSESYAFVSDYTDDVTMSGLKEAGVDPSEFALFQAKSWGDEDDVRKYYEKWQKFNDENGTSVPEFSLEKVEGKIKKYFFIPDNEDMFPNIETVGKIIDAIASDDTASKSIDRGIANEEGSGKVKYQTITSDEALYFFKKLSKYTVKLGDLKFDANGDPVVNNPGIALGDENHRYMNENTPCIIAGDAKIGKTTIGQQLSMAAINGGKFLGMRVQKGNVLFIDFETLDSTEFLRNFHNNALGNGFVKEKGTHPANKNKVLTTDFYNGISLLSYNEHDWELSTNAKGQDELVKADDFISALETLIIETGVKHVVIDPFVELLQHLGRYHHHDSYYDFDVYTPLDENNAADMSWVMRRLRRICKACSVNIFVCIHNNKTQANDSKSGSGANGVRGSSAIVGSAYFALYLDSLDISEFEEETYALRTFKNVYTETRINEWLEESGFDWTPRNDYDGAARPFDIPRDYQEVIEELLELSEYQKESLEELVGSIEAFLRKVDAFPENLEAVKTNSTGRSSSKYQKHFWKYWPVFLEDTTDVLKNCPVLNAAERTRTSKKGDRNERIKKGEIGYKPFGLMPKNDAEQSGGAGKASDDITQKIIDWVADVKHSLEIGSAAWADEIKNGNILEDGGIKIPFLAEKTGISRQTITNKADENEGWERKQMQKGRAYYLYIKEGE